MCDQDLLKVENLSVCFHSEEQKLQALRGISFSIARDECLGIVGESGSGKSVAMKAVLGLLPPSAEIKADKLAFEERDLLGTNEKNYRSLRGHEMTMIFQDPMTSLNPLKTVGSHLQEVLQRRQPGLSRAESRKQAVELLKKVGIPQAEQRLRQYPHEFSGGMRQRVLIAMALGCSPRLLIADEPTTALDVTIQAQILDLLNELRKEYRSSIILISHDLGVVANLCRKIVILYGGLIMETGTAEEIFYQARHPYTKALLQSVPTPDLQEGQRLFSIPGNPPQAGKQINGCPFAERCEHALPCCFSEKPPLHRFSSTQSSACFLHDGEMNL